MMQTDVKSVHLNTTGFAYIGRVRVRGLAVTTTSTGGITHIFDTLTAPVSANYTQSGYTVTVTKTSHGLTTGDQVGITFSTATGVSATNGNYIITKTGTDTFTITDINSRTITGTVVCTYVASSPSTQPQAKWITSFDITGAAGTTSIDVPGEGMLCQKGVYVVMQATEITSTTLFYA